VRTFLPFDLSVYEERQRHAAHAHEEFQLSIILSGKVAEHVRTVTEYGAPLSVVSKDSGVVHADEFGPHETRIARLSLRDGLLSQLIDDPSRAAHWRWTHDLRVARPFLRLAHRAARGNVRGFASDDADVVDLLSAFTAVPGSRLYNAPPKWIADFIRELRASWVPSLPVTDLARRARVHPVYLARCIRRWYGTGVAEELRRLRLQAAIRELAAGSDRVSTVAHKLGFADEAHLCREARRTIGLTPRSYRRLSQTANQVSRIQVS